MSLCCDPEVGTLQISFLRLPCQLVPFLWIKGIGRKLQGGSRKEGSSFLFSAVPVLFHQQQQLADSSPQLLWALPACILLHSLRGISSWSGSGTFLLQSPSISCTGLPLEDLRANPKGPPLWAPRFQQLNFFLLFSLP